MAGTSPCAHCKLLRRRCTADCIFAPYFPSDRPQNFSVVHKVFGASNVNKMLQELPVHQRADAVSSLVYEANARVRDPVHGCIGDISLLQSQVSELQMQLAQAQAQIPCIQNHEAVRGGKGKEAFETAVAAAGGGEAPESSHAASKRTRFTFDLNELPSGEDDNIMP